MKFAVTIAAWWFAGGALAAEQSPAAIDAKVERDKYGAVVRGDASVKKLALIFTGDGFGESAPFILDALKERGLQGSFFVTGNFVRNEQFRPYLRRMVDEGHYVGPHSDSHPLYCDWDDREKSLVTEEFFADDLRKNLAGLRALGAPPRGAPTYFVPPYEWYNGDQVRWSRRAGVELVNFTPGSGSNRDYAREGNAKFVPARQIYDDVLAYERREPHGLNGFLLLLHLGSGRRDPFHSLLGALCDELSSRGYQMVRIDELVGRQAVKSP